jgi:hypothetical protein
MRDPLCLNTATDYCAQIKRDSTISPASGYRYRISHLPLSISTDIRVVTPFGTQVPALRIQVMRSALYHSPLASVHLLKRVTASCYL